MRLGLDHEERAGGAERKSSARPASPDRCELVLEVEIAELVQNQEILAFAVMRAADQRDVALTARDARQRNSRGIRARDLLAHEGARGSANAVDNGDIAGQKIGKLRQ